MGNRLRLPIVAGAFYPGAPDALRRTVRALLEGDGESVVHGGPGALGLIVPHAGYIYSGPTAGRGFRRAAAASTPDTVVVLGANHTGFGSTVCLDDHDAWSTPLGTVPVDRDLVERLVARGIAVDRTAFVREHSIEVQLPFLQQLFPPGPAIVPICVQHGPYDTLADAGRTIAELVAGRSVWIVASSDFTHYEPDETARRIDRRALARITAFDPAGFFRDVVSERMTICGAAAIVVLMKAAAGIGLRTVELVDYTTSGDTGGDRAAVVGYAAVSFTGGQA
jgi:AmmeMemoRadiSam system protein B